MSGRAGRRGIDEIGYVYFMLRFPRIGKNDMADVLKELYAGKTPDITSAFKIRWTSLLLLLSTGPAHVHHLLSRSFLVCSQPQSKQELTTTSQRMMRVLQERDFVDEIGQPLQ